MCPHFADRLISEIRQKKTPLIVGLDPRHERLPAELHVKNPLDLAAVAESFRKFSCEIIDVVAPLVPAVKPQAAFFELLGPAGMIALGNVIRHAQEQNLIVILDAKRGDIGSTAQAYAQAYLGRRSPWGCDALTVNPYLGADTLEPFVETATEQGAGLFVLTKTSNPGSGMIQDLKIDNESIYARVATLIQILSLQTRGKGNYGCVGAVVGATYPEQLAELRLKMPNVILLIPGLGAQGGTAADLKAGFDEEGLGAVVNSSRAIIFAYEKSEFQARQNEWQRSVEQATTETIAEIAAETNAGRLLG